MAIDPDKPGGPTTNQTLLSNNDISGPGLFDTPLGLTVGDRRIFVADARGRVIAVDRDGQRRLITEGDNLASPVAIDLAPGPRLFVADSFGSENRDGSIVAVNPANGSQSLIAAGVINERDDLVEPSSIVVSQPTVFVADRDSQEDQNCGGVGERGGRRGGLPGAVLPYWGRGPVEQDECPGLWSSDDHRTGRSGVAQPPPASPLS